MKKLFIVLLILLTNTALAGPKKYRPRYAVQACTPSISNWNITAYEAQTGPYSGLMTGPYIVVKCTLKCSSGSSNGCSVVFYNEMFYEGVEDGTMEITKSASCNTSKSVYYLIPMSNDSPRGNYDLEIEVYNQGSTQPFTNWSYQFSY